MLFTLAVAAPLFASGGTYAENDASLAFSRAEIFMKEAEKHCASLLVKQ